jgi:hypothetical protein
VAAGPHARRRLRVNRRHPATTLAFRLGRPGLVRVAFDQVGCGRIASFRVRAHKGTNTIRVRRRVAGHRLPDGTYRIRGRSHGRTVLRATLVIGRGGIAPCALASVASRIENVFGALTAHPTPPSGGSSDQRAGAAAGGTGKTTADKDTAAVRAKPSSGLLGATASKILPDDGRKQLGLLIALVGAMLLLGVGALPHERVPHPAAATFLVRSRGMFAVAGLAVLAGAVVAYFLA